MGWSKATELAKVARREGERFECATWLHKAQEMPKEEFKREVERHLTGKETEAWEILYFKLYKSQLPVVEKALETAGLMLGTDKSRGYCLEMICADFLAGAKCPRPWRFRIYAETSPEATAIRAQRRRLQVTSPQSARTRWMAMSKLRLVERTCTCIILAKRSALGDDALDNLITLCAACHQTQHNFPTSARNLPA